MREREKPEKSLARIVWGWLFFIFLLTLVSFIIVHFVQHNTLVSGNAMYPALADGDRIMVDTVSYRILKPARFDVVIFPSRYEPDICYIRRVIGLPGETVQIADGRVLINQQPLDDPYGQEAMLNPGLASSVITLAANEYFVLGDNRNDSSDSREPIIGTIRGDEIIGRALMRIWPPERVKLAGF